MFVSVGAGSSYSAWVDQPHASHAVNDFRKLCGFGGSRLPTDNVSELTARINDDGWDGVFSGWLDGSRLSELTDCSCSPWEAEMLNSACVGNLVSAMVLAKERGASIFAIVGRDGGFAAKVADDFVVIPPLIRTGYSPYRRVVCGGLAPACDASPAGTPECEMGRVAVSAERISAIANACIVGGAGFIGSHFVDRLLGEPTTESVVVFDNFSSGREWHLERHVDDPRLSIVRGKSVTPSS